MIARRPLPATAPPPPGAVVFVADARTAGRLSGAFVRYRLTRRITWLNLAVLAALVIGFGVAVDVPWMGISLILSVPPLTFLGIRWSLTRQFRGPYGSGTRHWALFGDYSLTIAGPLGVTECRYDTFASVWRTPTVVVLRIRGLPTAYLVPAELVPPPMWSNLLAAVGR